MNLNIVALLCIFTAFTILGFSYKRQIHTKQKLTEEKLNKDAERFFVTICHKRLTNFGTIEQAQKYLEFRIYGQDFFVVHMESDGYGQKTKFKDFTLHAKFMGARILDCRTKIEHTYSSFENLLENVLGESLVYDFYVEHLWKELQKEGVK